MNSDTSSKDLIIKRLNRAEGQVRGIARMVSEDQQCFANETLTDKEMKQKSAELVGAMSRLLSR